MAGTLLLISCGSTDAESIEGEHVVVEMYDHRFQYTEIRIPVGGSVNWVGAGHTAHNAVEADRLWSTETVFGSLSQFEGDEAVLVYQEPGEYVFFCTFHGNAQGAGMAGRLIVGDG